jgi:hypothetical protein
MNENETKKEKLTNYIHEKNLRIYVLYRATFRKILLELKQT